MEEARARRVAHRSLSLGFVPFGLPHVSFEGCGFERLVGRVSDSLIFRLSCLLPCQLTHVLDFIEFIHDFLPKQGFHDVFHGEDA